MKVSDLLHELGKYNPDAEVRLHVDRKDQHFEVFFAGSVYREGENPVKPTEGTCERVLFSLK